MKEDLSVPHVHLIEMLYSHQMVQFKDNNVQMNVIWKRSEFMMVCALHQQLTVMIYQQSIDKH